MGVVKRFWRAGPVAEFVAHALPRVGDKFGATRPTSR